MPAFPVSGPSTPMPEPLHGQEADSDVATEAQTLQFSLRLPRAPRALRSLHGECAVSEGTVQSEEGLGTSSGAREEPRYVGPRVPAQKSPNYSTVAGKGPPQGCCQLRIGGISRTCQKRQVWWAPPVQAAPPLVPCHHTQPDPQPLPSSFALSTQTPGKTSMGSLGAGAPEHLARCPQIL